MSEKTLTFQTPDTRALFYAAPRRAEIRTVPDALNGNLDFPMAEAVARTLWSGLSRGTERLVFEGRVPESEREAMRAPHQEGDFPFPVKYGYAAVARVEEGPPELLGRAVFALHPHQTRLRLPVSAMIPLPEGVPPRRATLAANMETALNALWDAGAGPADRILVVGAGLLGLLTAALAARLPGSETTVVDIDPSRARQAEALGARFVSPQEAPGDADVVFHSSATADGLALSIAKAGLEARVVEMSWHGEGAVAIPLGGAFHSRRLQIVSSQVGQVSPSRRPRWPYRRRLAAALSLLADPVFDTLITHEVAFDSLPERLPELLAPGAPGLATAIRYD